MSSFIDGEEKLETRRFLKYFSKYMTIKFESIVLRNENTRVYKTQQGISLIDSIQIIIYINIKLHSGWFTLKQNRMLREYRAGHFWDLKKNSSGEFMLELGLEG